MKELHISELVNNLKINKIDSLSTKKEKLDKFSKKNSLNFKAGPFVTEESIDLEQKQKSLQKINTTLSTLRQDLKDIQVTTKLLESLGLDRLQVISGVDFEFIKEQDFAFIEENPSINNERLLYYIESIPKKEFKNVRSLLSKSVPNRIAVSGYYGNYNFFFFSFALPIAPYYMVERYKLLRKISNEHFKSEVLEPLRFFLQKYSRSANDLNDLNMNFSVYKGYYKKAKKIENNCVKRIETLKKNISSLPVYAVFQKRSFLKEKKKLEVDCNTYKKNSLSWLEKVNKLEETRSEYLSCLNNEVEREMKKAITLIENGANVIEISGFNRNKIMWFKVERRFTIGLIIDYSILEYQYKKLIKPALKNRVNFELEKEAMRLRGDDPQLFLKDNITNAVHFDRYYGGHELVGEQKNRDLFDEFYISM